MFSIGDAVVYGAQGVCRIEKIECRKSLSGEEEYYVLCPVYQKSSVILVPLKNEALTSRMYPIISVSRAKKLISVFKDLPDVWINDDTRRREEFKKVLTSGDRIQVAAIINAYKVEDERRKNCGKHLPQSDEVIFERAKAVLGGELAFVFEIEPREIENYIKKCLEKP